MTNTSYTKHTLGIQTYSGDPLSSDLLMAQDGSVSVYYAPFEWVNLQAKVVLVGITPGKTQAANALAEGKRALQAGMPADEVLKRAKATGAFSGPMRPNLVAMLDSVGINTWLGLASCSELFEDSSKLLQTSSVLQFPVFVDGANYNGTPDPTKYPLLRSMVLEHFGAQCSRLPDAIYVPLGPVPTKVLAWLTSQGVMRSGQVLSGLPHPSGANAERIKYFLGQKARSELSAKTDPDKLDMAREHLRAAVKALPRKAG